MKRRSMLIAGSAGCAAQCLLPRNTWATEQWPTNSPVRVVVPYPPGGTVDYAARQVAAQFATRTGGTFVVENRAGASGMIGTSYVASRPADGYTLLAIDSSYAMRPGTIKNIPYDSERTFVGVSTIFQAPFALVVPANSPFHTAGQLFDHARKNPSALKFGTGGVGTSTHLPCEIMMGKGGFKLQHIPYKGGGEVVLALMGGQVDVFVSSVPGVMGHLQGGKVKALALSGASRLAVLPDVPTFAEVGMAGFDAQDWIGIAALSGTPPAIVQRLSLALDESMKDRNFADGLVQRGAVPTTMPPQQFQAFMLAQIKVWSAVSAAAGLEPV